MRLIWLHCRALWHLSKYNNKKDIACIWLEVFHSTSIEYILCLPNITVSSWKEGLWKQNKIIQKHTITTNTQQVSLRPFDWCHNTQHHYSNKTQQIRQLLHRHNISPNKQNLIKYQEDYASIRVCICTKDKLKSKIGVGLRKKHIRWDPLTIIFPSGDRNGWCARLHVGKHVQNPNIMQNISLP